MKKVCILNNLSYQEYPLSGEISEFEEDDLKRIGIDKQFKDGKIVDYVNTELEISKLKSKLAKYKEDVEQVELFGMERADYEAKKKRCAEIIIELRKLEAEL